MMDKIANPSIFKCVKGNKARVMKIPTFKMFCLPTRLLRHPIVVVTGPQDNPPIEGQIITFTCAPGFVLTGPSTSACMWNGEWEPDPGEVDCIGNCLPCAMHIKFNGYSIIQLTVECHL